MKSIRQIVLALSLTATMSAPAFAQAPDSEPVKVATAAPVTKAKKRMTVHHATRSSSAKAQQRGDIGLDPTAGTERKIVHESRSLSSFISAEKERLRKSNLKFKTRKASRRVDSSVAKQLEKFNPDPLSFMDEPAAKKQRRDRRSKKK